MEKRRFYIVDVFAEEKYAGNQLAVIRDASGLSDGEMQEIARETNFSETTFILSEEPKQGGFDVRIFTPDDELPFAGHPTLGTAFILRNEVLAEPENEVKLNYKIGQITVTFRPDEACSTWMKQKTPAFGPVYDAASIAEVLGVKETDVDDRFAACHVFLTKFGDDGRPGRMAVAQYAGKIGALDQLIKELGRKGVCLAGEISPLEQHWHTRDLPVPARRVLATAQLAGETIGANELGIRLHASWKFAGTLHGGVHQSESGQVRELQRSGRTSIPLPCNMSKRI